MNLSNWNKNNILKFTIDNDLVDETLEDFPVLLNLSSGSGKNNYDCSEVFEHLTIFEGAPDEYTSLLIHSNTTDGSTTFIDSSLYGHPVTANDGIEHSTDLTVIGSSSIRPNRVSSTAGGHLTMLAHESFNFGGGDFTIDFYVKVANTADNPYFMAQFDYVSGAIGSSFGVRVNSSNLNFNYSTNGTLNNSVDSGVVMPTNILTHVAVVRSGVNILFFLDGILRSTINIGAVTIYASSEILGIGGIPVSYDGGAVWGTVDGYLDEIRISKGIARWVEDFTPQDFAYTGATANNKKIAIVYPSVQEHNINIFDVYTRWLVHSDDTDGSTNFIDSSRHDWTITSVGNVHHETDSFKFGASSLYFSGGSDQYLQISTTSTELEPVDQSFTIDCWVNITESDGYGSFFMIDSQTNFTFKYWVTGGEVEIYPYSTANYFQPNVTFPINEWHHVAFVRDSGTGTLYLDGVSVGTGTFNNTLVGTNFYIGKANSSEYFHGYIDEFRYSIGIARWTANFTPPTGIYTRTSEVFQYIHGEQEQLFCEIERWNAYNQEAQLWVKVPKVLSNQPTDIYLYYDSTQEDNTSYIGDTSSWSAQQVWDDNFVAVYHMSQDPSTGGTCILDSTSNSNNGTPYGNMTSSDLVGDGLDFDGIDDFIQVAHSESVTLSTITVESKIKQTVAGNQGIITKDSSGTGGGDWAMVDNAGDIDFRVNEGVGFAGAFVGVTNTVQYLAGTYDLANVFLYKDGTLRATDAYTGGLQTSTDPIIIGDYWTRAYKFNGTIYDIRISSSARSYPWLATTYNSNTDSLFNITKADIYQITGYVKELGSPAQRTVYLYDRVSGELVDKGVSNASTGYYSLRTTVSGAHNLVCVDALSAPDFDDLIISKITPTEII